MAAETATVTVTQVSPLLVAADGADTPNPALLTAGVVVAVGDRVQVTLRTPWQPIVTGKVDMP